MQLRAVVPSSVATSLHERGAQSTSLAHVGWQEPWPSSSTQVLGRFSPFNAAQSSFVSQAFEQ
jgi:hypothetical protein